MLKEILQVFSHNQFSMSAALLEENNIENKNIKLGELIAKGIDGEIYSDANNKNFILKKLSTKDRHYVEFETKETDYFNKYYGEGSAALIENDGILYIRMYKVPGVPIANIRDNIFPPNAQERFQHMICDLGDKGIMHGDFHLGNILYDKETNTFYPIDFSNNYEEYHSGDNDLKNSLNNELKIWYDWALEHIIKHTYY